MHSQQILELFANRQTIRHYRPEPLADGDLERIIEVGRRAATGAQAQVYTVIRVSDAELREQLTALAGNQAHIRDAAEFFVFCVDVYRTQRLLKHRGSAYGDGPRVAVHYGTMDAVLVASNMAIAAEALGYGTCFIGAILNQLDSVARELKLPQGVLPIVGLTIGVPADSQPPQPKPRLPLRLVFHKNRYQEPTQDELDAAFEAMGEKWYDTLTAYFGPNGRLTQRESVWLRALVQQGFEKPEGENTDD